MRTAIGLVLMAALASPVHAAKPARAPTAKWVVEFADAQCTASRNYGTKDNPLLLVFKQPPLGEVMQLAVVRPGGSGIYAEQVKARIGVDEAKPLDRTMVHYHADKANQSVLQMNMPLAEFAAVRGAGTLSVTVPARLDENFQLVDIGPVMRIMDKCVANLREAWNVDSASELRQGVTGNLQGIVTARDYPSVAISGNGQGTVQFAVLVDEKGRVADCTVTSTSGVAALDAQSCALVTERAQFKPAVGVDGKPAKASFVQRITWRLDGN